MIHKSLLTPAQKELYKAFQQESERLKRIKQIKDLRAKIVSIRSSCLRDIKRLTLLKDSEVIDTVQKEGYIKKLHKAKASHDLAKLMTTLHTINPIRNYLTSVDKLNWLTSQLH